MKKNPLSRLEARKILRRADRNRHEAQRMERKRRDSGAYYLYGRAEEARDIVDEYRAVRKNPPHMVECYGGKHAHPVIMHRADVRCPLCHVMAQLRAMANQLFELRNRLAVQGNPPAAVKIYERCMTIYASKAGMDHKCDDACRRAGHRYRHDFEKKCSIFGMPDGSIIISS